MECPWISPNGDFVGGLDLSALDASSNDYRIVAVVGCQSGGKSTLVNAAFSTNFPVLDAPKSGRRRTTLGIWAAVSPFNAALSDSTNSRTVRRRHPRRNSDSPPLIVLDVEGSDSRERGDGARAFESRTTLFALALGDVVIVNMWAHDIGRYSAANYELFEVVFAHVAALRRQAHHHRVFADARKVHIVMAIRDHDGESAIADIERVLLGDLENIWDSLNIQDMSFHATFRFNVTLFPHKLYAETAFDDAVHEFSSGFASQLTPAPKHIALAGFEAFAEAVWSAVRSSTGGDGHSASFTLNIPEHAALAAYFKCGEIAFHILQGPIREQLDALRAEIESEWRKPISDFGTRIDRIVGDSLDAFDTESSSFQAAHKAAVDSRRQELLGSLAERLLVVRDRYLTACRDFCMSGFENDFRPLLGGTSNFAGDSRRLVRRYTAQYRSLVDGAKLPSALRHHSAARSASTMRQISAGDPTPMHFEADPYIEDSSGATPERDIIPGEVESDDDADALTAERFHEEVMSLVDERQRFGELLLPGGAAGANMMRIGEPKKTPWWKGLLIRAAILLINYLQATQAHRLALKLHRKHEQEYPPSPTF